METSKKTNNSGILFVFVLLTVFLLSSPFLFGCSSSSAVVRSVSKDTVSVKDKTEDVSINIRESKDIAYERDSIYECHVYRNDTVTHYIYDARVEYRDRPTTEYIYKTLRDTVLVYKEKCDSVPVVIEVSKEKQLTLWQKQKLRYGGYALCVLLLELLAVGYSLLHRKGELI